MDIDTALFLGVLVGNWVLLFAIWRVIAKLLKLVAVLEIRAREHGQILELFSSQPRHSSSSDDT